MAKKIKAQLKRVAIHLLNSTQKYLLGDDIVSIKLRLFLLTLMGNKFGHGTKILAGCDVLGGGLSIGNDVTINRSCYFDLTGEVHIEDNVGVGHGVTFVTASHDIGPPENRAGHHHPGSIFGSNIILKKGCWVAANATVMPGVTVGEGAVAGACALVAKDVEPHMLVLGMPAKPVRSLQPEPVSLHRNQAA